MREGAGWGGGAGCVAGSLMEWELTMEGARFQP